MQVWESCELCGRARIMFPIHYSESGPFPINTKPTPHSTSPLPPALPLLSSSQATKQLRRVGKTKCSPPMPACDSAQRAWQRYCMEDALKEKNTNEFKRHLDLFLVGRHRASWGLGTWASNERLDWGHFREPGCADDGIFPFQKCFFFFPRWKKGAIMMITATSTSLHWPIWADVLVCLFACLDFHKWSHYIHPDGPIRSTGHSLLLSCCWDFLSLWLEKKKKKVSQQNRQ